MDFDYLIRKITEQRAKQQYLNALSYSNGLQLLLLKEFSDLQKGNLPNTAFTRLGGTVAKNNSGEQPPSG